VVIHADPDDYKSQPAGNSGKRIACGVIRAAATAVSGY
jgi:Cu-Zn family superoxide dismutase